MLECIDRRAIELANSLSRSAKIGKMRHLEKSMLQAARRRKAALLVHTEHNFENIDKLLSIGLLAHHVDCVHVGGHVKLRDVVKTIKDVFSRFFRLETLKNRSLSSLHSIHLADLRLKFLRRFYAPVCRRHVHLFEEAMCFRGFGQHLLRRHYKLGYVQASRARATSAYIREFGRRSEFDRTQRRPEIMAILVIDNTFSLAIKFQRQQKDGAEERVRSLNIDFFVIAIIIKLKVAQALRALRAYCCSMTEVALKAAIHWCCDLVKTRAFLQRWDISNTCHVQAARLSIPEIEIIDEALEKDAARLKQLKRVCEKAAMQILYANRVHLLSFRCERKSLGWLFVEHGARKMR